MYVKGKSKPGYMYVCDYYKTKSHFAITIVRCSVSTYKTSIDVLPSKNQALCEYCTLVCK